MVGLGASASASASVSADPTDATTVPQEHTSKYTKPKYDHGVNAGEPPVRLLSSSDTELSSNDSYAY